MPPGVRGGWVGGGVITREGEHLVPPGVRGGCSRQLTAVEPSGMPGEG